jgi:hypothetical protein
MFDLEPRAFTDRTSADELHVELERAGDDLTKRADPQRDRGDAVTVRVPLGGRDDGAR